LGTKNKLSGAGSNPAGIAIPSKKNNLNINNSMRLHEIEFKSERDFEDWLKRKQDRYEKYKRQEFNRQNKFKDSPFWRGFYAGKEVVPNTIDKIKQSYIGQTFKKISDLGRGS
jgi:hypothetical protein